MIAKLIRENITVINQGVDLLAQIPPAVYTAANSETYGSSPGAHFRHIIQHFQAYIKGETIAYVDYDHRDRTADIETDREAAERALMDIRSFFEAYEPKEKSLVILQNYDPSLPREPVTSSVGRELTFLVSHSIHHYALIAAILRLHGLDVPRYFGFAPSTLYYLAGAGNNVSNGVSVAN